MPYQQIEDYGIIGDTHTVALIGKNGSIDWFCYPVFDSASVFGRLLDENKGGYFQISPSQEYITNKQFYWPDTNVLVTRFYHDDGVVEITDFMPIVGANIEDKRSIIRKVRQVRGHMKMRMDCRPAFDYAREEHEIEKSDAGVSFHSKEMTLALSSKKELTVEGQGVYCEFTLHEGDEINFVLREIGKGENSKVIYSRKRVEDDFKLTVQYWRNWLSQSTYTGRWREMVNRSALALKLLTYAPTGAIVAAPTTSLPEEIGGERNWDYRYNWIRDSAFTIYAFLRIGFTGEARKYMEFITELCKKAEKKGQLQIMYGINGEVELPEISLDHLEGYKRSEPVRIGNGAYDQLQLDIYGELLDSVYLYNKFGSPISYELWSNIRPLVNWIADNWHQKDEGIWEVRGGKKHFVYSKVMAWVALDRALRLANKRSFPADYDKWRKVRDEIYLDIQKNGWDEERRAFTQDYDSDTLDASNLIMPLVFFLAPDDPRMLSTLDEIYKSPNNGGLVSNSLVYRYDPEKSPDGLEGIEGTFNMCTFWLAEAMTRAGKTDKKRLNEARLIFERMLGYSNHLGLYAEETGPCGEALGNFPQAFTHLSLISAAYNLNRQLGEDN